ncbi:MAG: 30S ribosomal protein S5, partial [Rhodospirillaceae bacterium]|nr:30S ribosomal protein S5 [Rhodospirillaceae bacterium]
MAQEPNSQGPKGPNQGRGGQRGGNRDGGGRGRGGRGGGRDDRDGDELIDKLVGINRVAKVV